MNYGGFLRIIEIWIVQRLPRLNVCLMACVGKLNMKCHLICFEDVWPLPGNWFDSTHDQEFWGNFCFWDLFIIYIFFKMMVRTRYACCHETSVIYSLYGRLTIQQCLLEDVSVGTVMERFSFSIERIPSSSTTAAFDLATSNVSVISARFLWSDSLAVMGYLTPWSGSS